MHRLVVSTLALLATAPLAAQDTLRVVPGQAALLGVRYPENVGPFAASRITRYPDPQLGMSVSYIAPGLRAEISVYVYPFPDDGSEELLAQQFAADWQGVRQYAEQSREMEVSVEGEGPVEITATDGTSYAGFRGELVMRRQGQSHASFLYLFRKANAYVKYRATYDRSIRLTLEPEVAQFLATTLAAIEP